MLRFLADTAPQLPVWLQAVLGSGVVVVGLPALTKQLGKARERRRALKASPVLKDAADIVELRRDVNRFNGWLLGNRDPFTGEYVGDGFKDTFPVFQREVLDRLEDLKKGTA